MTFDNFNLDDNDYNFVISNYALGELNTVWQNTYINNIISKVEHGYFCWNFSPSNPNIHSYFTNKDIIKEEYQYYKERPYNVDQIFYGIGQTPPSIDADELSRAETRQINYIHRYIKIAPSKVGSGSMSEMHRPFSCAMPNVMNVGCCELLGAICQIRMRIPGGEPAR